MLPLLPRGLLALTSLWLAFVLSTRPSRPRGSPWLGRIRRAARRGLHRLARLGRLGVLGPPPRRPPARTALLPPRMGVGRATGPAVRPPLASSLGYAVILGLVLVKAMTPRFLPMARTTRGLGLSVRARLSGTPRVPGGLVVLPWGVPTRSLAAGRDPTRLRGRSAAAGRVFPSPPLCRLPMLRRPGGAAPYAAVSLRPYRFAGWIGVGPPPSACSDRWTGRDSVPLAPTGWPGRVLL